MNQEYLDEFAEMHGFVAAIRTSAKTGLNINTAFSELVRQVFVQEFSGTQNQLGMEDDMYAAGRGTEGKSTVKQSFRLDDNNQNNKDNPKKSTANKKSKCC